VKKEVHFGLSNEGEHAHKTRGTHPAVTGRLPSLTLLARCECQLERHGVGEGESELGADFNFFLATRLPFSGRRYGST
jgi:hypothetical protein